LDGKAEIRIWTNSEGKEESLHEDLDAAKFTVKKLKSFESDYGAHIALAHDSTWMQSGTDEVLMSLLDSDLQEFARDRLSVGESP